MTPETRCPTCSQARELLARVIQRLETQPHNDARDREALRDSRAFLSTPSSGAALLHELEGLRKVRDALLPVLECVTEGREPGDERWQRLINATAATWARGRTP
jgi:hypothetical protein